MKKRGELTTQQIVGLIILIVSFSIILLFIFRLDLGQTTDKEICHNSVVLKSQSVLDSGNLDCKTSYVCISGGGECEGINPTRTIDINLNDDVKNQVFNAIAEEMSDCWWMFGEGEIDYSSGIDLGVNEKLCSLCSVVSFDENIQNKLEKLNSNEKTLGEFYKYLKTNEKEEGTFYLEYLTGKNTYEESEEFYTREIDFSSEYVILTGIAKKGFLGSIINSASGYVDWFNDVFFSWIDYYIVEIPNAKEDELVAIPVLFMPKENLNDLQCDSYLTKA